MCSIMPISFLLGAPFSMARAEGNPLLAMGCFLAGTILNLILAPVYIFVLGWGDCHCDFAAIVRFHFTGVFFEKRPYSVKDAKPLSNVSGLRAGCRASTSSLYDTGGGRAFANGMKQRIVRYGAAAVSSLGIVLKISSAVVSVCIEIALGKQPVIGFNKGAGLERRVKETFQKAVGAATVVSLVRWLYYELFPSGILWLFGMDAPAYMEFGIRCMRVFLFRMAGGWFPVCVIPISPGNRVSGQGDGACYPSPCSVDDSLNPYFFPCLGAKRYSVCRPGRRFSGYAGYRVIIVA